MKTALPHLSYLSLNGTMQRQKRHNDNWSTAVTMQYLANVASQTGSASDRQADKGTDRAISAGRLCVTLAACNGFGAQQTIKIRKNYYQ